MHNCEEPPWKMRKSGNEFGNDGSSSAIPGNAGGYETREAIVLPLNTAVVRRVSLNSAAVRPCLNKFAGKRPLVYHNHCA